ncbi:MAG: FecR domain-containing protein [Pseudomonadota bacterium]
MMASPDSPKLPKQDILQQAADWFATLADDEVSEQDRAAWRQWLDKHQDHQLAWQYVERVGLRFNQAQNQPGSGEAGRILKSTRSELIQRRKLLSGGLTAIAGFTLWRYTPLAAYSQNALDTLTAGYKTGTGETHALTLSDRGQLWLNTASAVDVRFTTHLRNIKLHRGEVLVQTSPDPRQRPFVVTTNPGTLRALGTRFGVRKLQDSVRLSVYEGAVEITTHSGKTTAVPAGQGSMFNATDIEAPYPVSDARESWIRGVIVADSMPLGQLVAELSRYRHGYLGVNPAIAELSVVGTFPIDNPDQALAMLQDALPLNVKRTLPWWISLEPQ